MQVGYKYARREFLHEDTFARVKKTNFSNFFIN